MKVVVVIIINCKHLTNLNFNQIMAQFSINIETVHLFTNFIKIMIIIIKLKNVIFTTIIIVVIVITIIDLTIIIINYSTLWHSNFNYFY